MNPTFTTASWKDEFDERFGTAKRMAMPDGTWSHSLTHELQKDFISSLLEQQRTELAGKVTRMKSGLSDGKHNKLYEIFRADMLALLQEPLT